MAVSARPGKPHRDAGGGAVCPQGPGPPSPRSGPSWVLASGPLPVPRLTSPGALSTPSAGGPAGEVLGAPSPVGQEQPALRDPGSARPAAADAPAEPGEAAAAVRGADQRGGPREPAGAPAAPAGWVRPLGPAPGARPPRSPVGRAAGRWPSMCRSGPRPAQGPRGRAVGLRWQQCADAAGPHLPGPPELERGLSGLWQVSAFRLGSGISAWTLMAPARKGTVGHALPFLPSVLASCSGETL